MSRHFSYEIDERRIRILLKENTLPFSEETWKNYLQQSKPIDATTKIPQLNLPAISISKPALLTGVFIILVGGFTFLIAKFVDFSGAKSNINLVREVKPEPDNYRLPQSPEIESSKSITENTQPKDSIKTEPLTVLETNTVQPIISSPQPSTNSNTLQVTNLPKNSVPEDSSNKTVRKKPKKEVEIMESKPLNTNIPLITPEEPELELK